MTYRVTSREPDWRARGLGWHVEGTLTCESCAYSGVFGTYFSFSVTATWEDEDGNLRGPARTVAERLTWDREYFKTFSLQTFYAEDLDLLSTQEDPELSGMEGYSILYDVIDPEKKKWFDEGASQLPLRLLILNLADDCAVIDAKLLYLAESEADDIAVRESLLSALTIMVTREPMVDPVGKEVPSYKSRVIPEWLHDWNP